MKTFNQYPKHKSFDNGEIYLFANSDLGIQALHSLLFRNNTTMIDFIILCILSHSMAFALGWKICYNLNRKSK